MCAYIKKKRELKKPNKTKNWLLEKVGKTDKPLHKLTRRRREETQINKIRDGKGNITTNSSEIEMIMKEYFENLYSNKLENLEEINEFLDTFDLPKLNQDNVDYFKRFVKRNEVKAVI
jgi:hypothetical protein